MHAYISLLRGINVSGQKKIAMAELSQLYTQLGFVRVTTYIQSGNVVFGGPAGADFVGARIEAEIHNRYGYAVPVFLRTPADFKQIVSENPFSHSVEIKNLYVVFLREAPAAAAVGALAEGPEKWQVRGKEIYLYCPNGMGKAKLNNSYFEKKLDMPATCRNWNTVQRLLALGVEVEVGTK